MFVQGYTGTGALVFVSGNPSLVQRGDYECALAPVVVRRLFKQVQRDYPHGLSNFLNLLCTAQEHELFSKDPAYRAAMDIERCPDREAALSTLACLQTEDLRPHLSRITAPTLIVHGESDEICLSGAGRFMNDSIPGSRLLMLPDTGHMPFISRRQRVVEAVLNFLGM
jgi:pimeloyl-[acyl-carrier protein] methyl ester esterase